MQHQESQQELVQRRRGLFPGFVTFPGPIHPVTEDDQQIVKKTQPLVRD